MLLNRLMVITLSAMLFLGYLLLPVGTTAKPLDQVIEGARKEGTVSAKLRVTIAPKSMKRLEREIKEKFGVDLKIICEPGTSMPKDAAVAIMEYKTGVTPSFDLMHFHSGHILGTLQTAPGIFETVDWKSLFTEDTNPEVLAENATGPSYFSGGQGLLYNPTKISAAEVPKVLGDLSDPKWKGKVGIMGYTGSWARWAFVKGKDKIFSELRAILKNDALRGRYMDLFNRYMLGEIWMMVTKANYIQMAQDKGLPAAFQSLDYLDVRETQLVIRKGAKHPNAARLVAVYLASPAGAKFMLEEGAAGTLFYPGNYEHDILSQTKKQGIPIIFTERDMKILEFEASKEVKQWEKEVKLIFDTGGGKIQTKKKKTK
ncbi:MAG: ABC transporter substrate-binding protein [Desulfobacterales bacterium]|nr:ABC transporter substrate-binding protein [Desulfobacterales bacterium]